MKARARARAALLAAAAVVTTAGFSQTSPPTGITAVLLLDVSASVSQQSLRIDDRFVRMFNMFLQMLQPADRAAVGLLANRVRLTPLTTDRTQLSASMRTLLQVPDVDRLGPTPIWDALDDAISLLSDDNSRRAIILYTDGRSSGNVHGLSEIIDRATRAHVSIHAVIPPQRLSPDRLDPADLIEQLTSATGGQRLIEQRFPGSAVALVSQIMDAMHRK